MLSIITPIGWFFLVGIVACLVGSPRSLIWLMAIALPFSHTAMLVVGSNGLSPFWCVALVAVGRLFYLQFRRTRNLRRARRARGAQALSLTGSTLALLFFGAYALLITAVGPALFEGVGVITPRGGLDSQIDNFTPLTYTTSNVAQTAYVTVGVLLVMYLITEPPRSIRVIEAAIVTGFALTLFKHFLPDSWPQEWFDSNPSYYYHWIFDGARERGPFAEPSLMGMFLGMSLAYLVASFWRASLVTRVFYSALIGIGVYLYSVSYTGTALLALGSVAGAAVLYGLWRIIRYGTKQVRIYFASAFALITLIVFVFWNVVSKYTLDIVVEKLGSDSFANRNASNVNSFRVLLDSFGLGVGLGSDRPSSLFFVLLSCVGIVGTLLFMRATAGYLAYGLRTPSVSPIAWAFMAQLIAQLVAKPDISMPGLWLLMGVLAASYNAREMGFDTEKKNVQPTFKERIGTLIKFP